MGNAKWWGGQSSARRNGITNRRAQSDAPYLQTAHRAVVTATLTYISICGHLTPAFEKQLLKSLPRYFFNERT